MEKRKDYNALKAELILEKEKYKNYFNEDCLKYIDKLINVEVSAWDDHTFFKIFSHDIFIDKLKKYNIFMRCMQNLAPYKNNITYQFSTRKKYLVFDINYEDEELSFPIVSFRSSNHLKITLPYDESNIEEIKFKDKYEKFISIDILKKHGAKVNKILKDTSRLLTSKIGVTPGIYDILKNSEEDATIEISAIIPRVNVKRMED